MKDSLHRLAHDVTFALRNYILPAKESGNAAQGCITGLLLSEAPCMIARFGSAEIQGVISGILPPPQTVRELRFLL